MKVSAQDCHLTKCPNQECENIVPDTIFKKLLEEEKFDKYEKFAFPFVKNNKLMKWCPGKNCEKVLEVKENDEVECFCECGEAFCFACDKPAHNPISCQTLQAWYDRTNANN